MRLAITVILQTTALFGTDVELVVVLIQKANRCKIVENRQSVQCAAAV
jgi:hypothetical protein